LSVTVRTPLLSSAETSAPVSASGSCIHGRISDRSFARNDANHFRRCRVLCRTPRMISCDCSTLTSSHSSVTPGNRLAQSKPLQFLLHPSRVATQQVLVVKSIHRAISRNSRHRAGPFVSSCHQLIKSTFFVGMSSYGPPSVRQNIHRGLGNRRGLLASAPIYPLTSSRVTRESGVFLQDLGPTPKLP